MKTQQFQSNVQETSLEKNIFFAAEDFIFSPVQECFNSLMPS